MKTLITLFLVSFFFKVFASPQSPNEEKIFFHLHQATRWAELYYSKNTLFAKDEIREHLGKIKYSEIKLVNSIFYSDFLFLNRLTQNMNSSSYKKMETFRATIHSKAQENLIKHPENWKSEFALVESAAQ